MATMNISLPDQMKNWVEENVQTGRYANASDYIRDLIREDHAQLEKLRTALMEGEASGDARKFEFEAFLASRKKSMHL